MLSVFHPSLPYPGTTPNNLVFNNKTLDTVDGYNTSTGVYTVKSSRRYKLSASIIFGHSGSANQYISPSFFRNGTVLTNCIGVDLVENATVPLRSRTGECEVYLNAGDQITLRINGTNLTSPVANTNGYSSMTIKGTGPSSYAIPMGPVIVDVSNTAGTSIGSSYNLIPFATKTKDTHGLWNGTRFTVQEPGDYDVDTMLTTAAVTLGTGDFFRTNVYLNGTLYRGGMKMQGTGVAGVTYYSKLSTTLTNLKVGDYIEIYSFGAATTLSTTSGYNYLTIKKVK